MACCSPWGYKGADRTDLVTEQQKIIHPPQWQTLGLGCEICGSDGSLPRKPVFPSEGAGPDLTASLPFLQPWLYTSLWASLQLAFSENYSRCIFNVFMEGR